MRGEREWHMGLNGGGLGPSACGRVGGGQRHRQQRRVCQWAGLGRHSALCELFKYVSNQFERIRSKEVLPLLKNIQLKYGCVDNLMGNKLPHWNFSKFELEFELKIGEPI
jgi:hypothetical protein